MYIKSSLIKIILILLTAFLLNSLLIAKEDKIIYEYVDSNNNRYIIQSKKDNAIIHYVPIKAKQSSSGVYDGGKPFKKSISLQNYEKLKTLLDKSFQSKKDHEKQRKMGTSIIRVTQKGKTHFVLLAYHSKLRKEIEFFLTKTLSNNKTKKK